ncbi:hypothetical protein SLS63_014187 [Diaporthe eres]|uniref:Uncharacterized protein n=1 Tax=Diaporthe eres TaxID=83184 RepID=A0ABR1NKI1_DIAER
MVFFRSMDAQLPEPILGDPYSQGILDRCDVDLKAGHFIRDDRFIEYLRMRTSTNVRWIDVDQPRVVEARNSLLPQPPGDYTLRALQVTKTGWLKDLPNDRTTLVVAEGLFPFLTATEGKQVLHDIVNYFSRGQIITDHVSPMVARLSSSIKFLRTSGSRFQWGVGDPRKEIEPVHQKLRMKGCLHWSDFMEEHPPIFGGTMTRMMGVFLPGWESNLKLLRFEY